MNSDNFVQIVSGIIGRRLLDIIGYGWLERHDGKAHFALRKTNFDFVFDNGVVRFHGDETEITVRIGDASDLLVDYTELGEPCSASLFDALSFVGESQPMIRQVDLYTDVQNDRLEALQCYLGNSGFSVFLQLDNDLGLQISSPLEDVRWRDWRKITSRPFHLTVVDSPIY